MNCKKIHLLLSPYQDHECDEKTSSEIFTHLQKCEQCRKEYELMEQIKEEITKLSIIEPETYFTKKLMSKLKQKKKSKIFLLPSMIYSIVFIIFFIMGILVNKDIAPKKEEITISQILLQSQNLNAIFIEDETFDLLNNGEKNE